MNKKIEQEKVQIILSYFYLILNAGILLVTLYIFNTRNKKLISVLRKKLYVLLILNSVPYASNIFDFYLQSLFGNFYYKIFYSFLFSIQFFIIISYVYDVIDTTRLYKEINQIELISSELLGILCFFFMFPYEEILKLSERKIKIVQDIIIISVIILLNKYFRDITSHIMEHLNQKNISRIQTFNYIKYMNNLGLGCLIAHYLICIISRLSMKKIFEIYFISPFFYIISKYLFISFLVSIIYSLSGAQLKRMTEENSNLKEQTEV